MRIICTFVLLLVSIGLRADELGLVTADGFGTVDGSRFSGPQAKMLARRAAIVDAQRNLVELVDGVRITSGTTVKDMMLQSDIIGSRVKGMVRGAFVEQENIYEDEGSWIAEVKMAVCLNSGPSACKKRPTLTALMQPELKKPAKEKLFTEADAAPENLARPGTDAKVDVQEGMNAEINGEINGETNDELNNELNNETNTVATAGVQSQGTSPAISEGRTGLILDLSGLGFSPLLDVRVQTAGGKELYGPGHVGEGVDWLHWSNSVDGARGMEDIVGSSPLVVKATGIGTDNQVLVSQDAAVEIFRQNLVNGEFLKQGKVVFVVN